MTASFDEIKKLHRLSLHSAVVLFKMKLMPIISYGLSELWEHLTESDLKRLEQSFTFYMKRALCLHRSARNRYVYALSGSPLMVDEIRERIRGVKTDAFEAILQAWNIKATDALAVVSQEEIFRKPELWASSALNDRHVFTRYLVHGYHHHLCKNSSYHEPNEALCVCRYCGESCPKYHGSRCQAENVSLHFLSRQSIS